jgi:hypothetical protein
VQNLTESKLAEMPSCNLAETKHNAWLQESSNRGNDFYVASVDDFVKALIQVSRYYQFLKGEYAGTGPGKEELMLRVAQRSALRVNFSRPQIRTRSTAAAGASCSLSDILEEPSTDLQEHPIPNVNSKTIHMTAIHETACTEIEWHIARLPKTSA